MIHRNAQQPAGVVRFERERPPFYCAACGRRIGRHATHYVLITMAVVCGRCEHRYEVGATGTRAGLDRVLR